jgi:5'-nucleotidase
MAVVLVGMVPGAEASAPAKKARILKILVTNDDGVGAEGIDALVEALLELPRVRVTVVAPATNQSGSSDKTTPGGLPAVDATTASGYPAKSVAGFPADSVNAALDGAAPKKPNVVISGINEGQNLGALTDISGTVGAARTAARRGIPALAVSQGLAEAPDFESGAREAVKWLKEHRKALAKKGVEPFVDNLNVPTCATGELRGVIEVPVAPNAENAIATSDCASTLTDPVDDIQAFNNGYVTLSDVGF